MRNNVTVIPATKQKHSGLPVNGRAKKRVAGYARVSTDHDEQFSSYEAQIDYYTHYIQRNPDWEFIKVYTDEGISGTNTKHRNGFNEMITDALGGKIDLIVTKSVSRFARNTVDSLVTIRKLKEKGVECYFEKENIYTFDGKGELLLTIMSSLAQEESRSISENVTWGQRKRFSDGKMSLAYSHFLGYEKGPDEEHPLVIVEDEAKTIVRIYHEFLLGKTPGAIANGLTADGILTPTGKPKWSSSTVMNILTNEKYAGSALLQKSYTADFLTKKLKKNTGEIPQYFIEHSHEPIIPPDEWELVQRELERRKELGMKYSGKSVFAARLVCGDCGAFLGPKTWNSTNKYKRTVWQCNDKFKGEKKCSTPHLTEDDIRQRFITAFNKVYSVREQLIKDCRLILELLTDTKVEDDKLAELLLDEQVTGDLARKCIEDNARGKMDRDEFNTQYARIEERYTAIETEIEEQKAAKENKSKKEADIRLFMKELEKRKEPLTQFDEMLWLSAVEYATLRNEGSLVFRFRNGTEIEC